MPYKQPTVLEHLTSERLKINANLHAPWNYQSPGIPDFGPLKPSSESILRPLLGLSHPLADSTWNALAKLDVLLSGEAMSLPSLAGMASNPLLPVALAQARAGTGSALGRWARSGTPTPEAQRAVCLVYESSRRSLAAMGLTSAQVSAVEVHAFSESSASLVLDATVESTPKNDKLAQFLTIMGFGEGNPGTDFGSDALNFEAVFGVLGRADYAHTFAPKRFSEGAGRGRQNPVYVGGLLSGTPASLPPFQHPSGQSPVPAMALAYFWLAHVWRFEPDSGLDLTRAHILKAACDFAIAHAQIKPLTLPSDRTELDALSSHAEAAILHSSTSIKQRIGGAPPRIRM